MIRLESALGSGLDEADPNPAELAAAGIRGQSIDGEVPSASSMRPGLVPGGSIG